MAVSSKYTFVKNQKGGKPYRVLLPTQAGATQAIKRGEICKLSAGNMVPLAADEAMVAIIAVYDDKDIVAGDLAGYRWFIVPTEHDVFEYAIAAAAAARGAALYFGADSQTLTTVVGTNIIGNVVDHDGFPKPQGSLSNGDIYDRGTTVGSVVVVHMTFKKAVSLAAAYQT